jgi:hypothetical protein
MHSWTFRSTVWTAACSVTLLASRASGQATDHAPAPCRADSTYHRLDFWLGAWRVTVDGKLDGTDSVRTVLDGCAITETWHDVNGHAGLSLFYVAPGSGRWKQVWVTDQARMTGGTKEKSALIWYPDGGVRFQGELVGSGGKILLDRTTLTPMPDGTVRQLIEISTDGGSTWQQSYRATYTRMRP